MVLLYHPDKNNSPSAILLFSDLQEAYGTLIHKHKKARYDLELLIYKPHVVSAKSIKNDIHLIEITQKLIHQLSILDKRDIDEYMLINYLLWLVHKDTIYPIIKSSDNETLSTLFNNLKTISGYLHAKQKIPLMNSLLLLKKELSFSVYNEEIRSELAKAVKEERYRKRLPYIILISGILICTFIYMLSRYNK